MQQIHSMVKNKKYTVAEQLHILRATYPNSSSFMSKNGFTWSFDVTPLALSDTYTIKIVYNQSMAWPNVYISRPKPLKLADGADKLPHCYDTKKQQLCLFYPKYREWDNTKQIAATIVHWAIMWIVYYESWVITGKWQGGGHGNWDAIKLENANS